MSSTIKVNNIQNLAGDDSGIDLSTNDQIILKTANTTAVTVDSSQGVTCSADLTVDTSTLKVDSTNNRVGIGTASPADKVHIIGADGATSRTTYQTSSQLILENNSDTSIDISTGTTHSGFINFHDTDAVQQGFISYGHTNNLMRFGTNGSERVRIDSSGHFMISTTENFPHGLGSGGVGTNLRGDGIISIAGSGTCPLRVNRTTNDGEVAQWRQNGTQEGSITVSGTTVSYNGGHLSRWSQLADNTRDNTLVKGTVMTNLDQMAEWTTDGVTEDNEQLNCMAVSSVEGDANVAGVFVNWDDDDDIYTNDMNIAMTGDMVIRIAQGTTVARGDLLISAGDGTAKPQDDDIVRSKTIAKVTSTNVSHTYDDGTYLVPCVLMAC